MNMVKYSVLVHMARTPYERVPNINNLFIIYPLICNGRFSYAYSCHLQAWSTFHLAIIYVKSIISNNWSLYYYTRGAPPLTGRVKQR